MDDLISRKTALDAFGLSEKTRKYGGDHSGYYTRMLYEIQDTLENLPAVQPDHVADISKKVKVEDCIGRQMVIDALDMAIERYDEMAEEYRKKADIERNDYMDMRDDAYEAQQLAQWLNELKYLREKIEQITIKPEQRWIPCSERLPKKMGYYLTTNEYKVVHEDYYCGNCCFEKAKKYQCEVVAWMPMPIPPYCGGNGE